MAEFFGTFCLIFCGTGAIIIDQETSGSIGHLGVSITFGLIVSAMIYTFGNISGAHLNPSVTLGFTVSGLFPKNRILCYILAQGMGAIISSISLKFLFPHNILLGGTYPLNQEWQSFLLETILSLILMLVILFTSQGSKETGTMAGLAIGGVILLEALFAGPISGASMNPIRSLSPELISGNFHSIWIYLTAPFLGTIMASLVWRFLK